MGLMRWANAYLVEARLSSFILSTFNIPYSSSAIATGNVESLGGVFIVLKLGTQVGNRMYFLQWMHLFYVLVHNGLRCDFHWLSEATQLCNYWHF